MESLIPISKLTLIRNQNKQDLLLKLKKHQEKAFHLENKISIRYAFSIQRAILPNISIFLISFKDAFVFYQPKDLLSSYFYWYFRHKYSIYFTV